jgi:Fe-S-cluster containining protein
MTTLQTSCERCGKCCQQGGPALHLQDLELIRSGLLPTSNLITIRQGELVHNPLTGTVQPAAVELVKIAGTGKHWVCCYYDQTKGCTIHDHRPHACRTLKCWDTREVCALIEKDTLSRFDILPADDLLLPVLREHSRICPCDDLAYVRTNLARLSNEKKKELENRVGEELRLRLRAVAEHHLGLRQELFYFGRPLFQLLSALGVGVADAGGGVRLRWKG